MSENTTKLNKNLLNIASEFKQAHSGFLVAWRGLGPETAICSSFIGSVVGALQDRETAHQGVIHGHKCARIVEFSAVVRCTKNGDKLTSTEEFISVFDDLMGTANQVNIIFLQEALNNSLAERV